MNPLWTNQDFIWILWVFPMICGVFVFFFPDSSVCCSDLKWFLWDRWWQILNHLPLDAIGSKYGIFTYMWLIFIVNVGILVYIYIYHTWILWGWFLEVREKVIHGKHQPLKGANLHPVTIFPTRSSSLICSMGLNSHYFHIIGDGHQPNSRGLYTHCKDSLLKVGCPSPIQRVDRPWLIICSMGIPQSTPSLTTKTGRGLTSQVETNLPFW